MRRTISVSHAVALYIGAVVGAGVLILPGAAASMAGPASVVAWVFDATLGIPIALTFAALASRFPDAGGVASYVSRAFAPGAGTVIGWFYFFATATGIALVSLTGAYYAAEQLALDLRDAHLLAGAILVAAALANARGLRVSARVQLSFSGAVVLMLLAAITASLPRLQLANWTPFAPHGIAAVGRASVLIFFAFFGWEAITHLSAEFRDPRRDVPRSTLLAVFLIAVLLVGVAVATVGTGTYGAAAVNRTVVARLIADPLGTTAGGLAAAAALLIALATVNAVIAATSRLGYALARDGAFPRAFFRLSRQRTPVTSVVFLGCYACVAVGVSYLVGWGAEDLLVVPNSLIIMTYVAGTAAGVRLLAGVHRVLAVLATVLCVALLPFAGISLLIPVVVTIAALAYRRVLGRRTTPRAEPGAPAEQAEIRL